MEICSDSDDQQQMSKLSEDYQQDTKSGKKRPIRVRKIQTELQRRQQLFRFPARKRKSSTFHGSSLCSSQAMEQRSSRCTELLLFGK